MFLYMNTEKSFPSFKRYGYRLGEQIDGNALEISRTSKHVDSSGNGFSRSNPERNTE